MIIQEQDKIYLFLSCVEVSYKRAVTILEKYNNINSLFNDIKSKNPQVKELFGTFFEKACEKQEVFDFEILERFFEKRQMQILTFENEKYPEQLRQLDQPPLVLYAKGDLSLLQTDGIAIVGSRSVSFYGKEVTENFAKELAIAGFTIVSGLAVGVDKIAHETALSVNGKTIAVLGSGLEHIYPALNFELANKIAEKGLIISEYYPSFAPTNYSFPTRNRIIAALSKGVLITEAGKKSGALHTRDYALDLGRDIFAVPGNITSSKCEGTNNIIKCCQGACVTTPQDILKQYGIDYNAPKKKKIQITIEEQTILQHLKDGEKQFDYLQEKTKMSAKNLNYCLTTMEIRGIIKKLPGNFYSA